MNKLGLRCIALSCVFFRSFSFSFPQFNKSPCFHSKICMNKRQFLLQRDEEEQPAHTRVTHYKRIRYAIITKILDG